MGKIASYPTKKIQVGVRSVAWLWIEGDGIDQYEERRHHFHGVDEGSDKGERKRKQISVYHYDS